MKILWSVFVLTAALLVSRAYASYTETARAHYNAFICFLEGLSRRIALVSGRIDDWCRECEVEVLRKIGFIDAYFNTGRLISAFEHTEDRLYLTERARESLTHYFSSAGHGYADAEIKSIESCLDTLHKELSEREAEWGTRKRTVAASAVSLALGIIIMLL